MATTYSEAANTGTVAHHFSLRSANPQCDTLAGDTRSLDDYASAPVIVIVFMCNHCPYVKHVRNQLVSLSDDYTDRDVQLIGINSNDAAAYPEDSFEKMVEEADRYGYTFPYLHDESQEVARAYGAVCTPDVFVYDSARELVYRGRLDGSRPGKGESNGEDLRRALDELLKSGVIDSPQYPSVGCSIKWRRTG